MLMHILVPLDGSELSERALEPAARMARAANAAVSLVHVHDASTTDPILVEDLPVIDEDLHSLATVHEQAYLDRIAARPLLNGLQVHTARLEGMIAPALIGYAREHGVDLILLTSHGYNGFMRFWIGSVAERLLRWTATPVLMLRSDEEVPAAFRRILVPLDGSEEAAAILSSVSSLARTEQAAVTLIQIQESEQAAAGLEEYAIRLRAKGIPTQVRVEQSKQPVKAILAAATEEQADLLAFSVSGSQRTNPGALGHVADKLLRAAPIPVLVVHPRAT